MIERAPPGPQLPAPGQWIAPTRAPMHGPRPRPQCDDDPPRRDVLFNAKRLFAAHRMASKGAIAKTGAPQFSLRFVKTFVNARRKKQPAARRQAIADADRVADLDGGAQQHAGRRPRREDVEREDGLGKTAKGSAGQRRSRLFNGDHSFMVITMINGALDANRNPLVSAR